MASSEKKPILGYWKIRALAEPARSMLHYGGVDFEEKRYSFGDGEDFKEIGKEWFADKFGNSVFTEEFAFANLPYWIEGDLRLTQSLAIYRHVARKVGLMPEGLSPNEQATLDMLEQQITDLRWNLVYYGLDVNLLKLRYPNYLEALPDVLKPYSKYLGDKKWLMGDKLSYIDFMFYEALDGHTLAKPDCLDGFPNLKEFLKRFRNIPQIEEYHASDRYIHWPLFGAVAKVFGYKRD